MSAVANQAIMNRPPRAAVVGAGIAGLSCATLLQSAGFEVGVFDKSRGPSGRMSTRRGDDWQCDHGAQYFTARNPDFRAEVARWQHAGVAASWRPRLHVLGDPSAHVPDPALERFVGVPRMSAPCRFLADGLGIEVGTSIRQLQRRPDGWHLLSAERGWLDRSFDVALLALPAPQAAPLLREAAPGLAALAGNVVMRGAWALMLRCAALRRAARVAVRCCLRQCRAAALDCPRQQQAWSWRSGNLAAARQRRVERGASGRRRRPRPHDAATGLRRFGSSRRGTPGGAGVGDAPLALRRLRHQPGSPLPL